MRMNSYATLGPSLTAHHDRLDRLDSWIAGPFAADFAQTKIGGTEMLG
jgi:hypothetical protein